jgi:hypothetical protein
MAISRNLFFELKSDPILHPAPLPGMACKRFSNILLHGA